MVWPGALRHRQRPMTAAPTLRTAHGAHRSRGARLGEPAHVRWYAMTLCPGHLVDVPWVELRIPRIAAVSAHRARHNAVQWKIAARESARRPFLPPHRFEHFVVRQQVAVRSIAPLRGRVRVYGWRRGRGLLVPRVRALHRAAASSNGRCCLSSVNTLACRPSSMGAPRPNCGVHTTTAGSALR